MYLKKLYFALFSLILLNYPLKGFCSNYIRNNYVYDPSNTQKGVKGNSQINFNNFIKYLAENIDKPLKNIENYFNYFDIVSNKQLRTKDEFIAEGDVIIKNGNRILKTDKLSYNLITKNLKLVGNIYFKSGEQFLKSSAIEYNLNSKKGLIKDAYGVINFDTLDLINLDQNKDIYLDEKINFDTNISEVRLNKSSSLELNDITSLQNTKLEINNMTKWRFKADEIKLEKNIWSSDILYLTNDPFNKPQLVIKNTNFKSIDLGNEIILKTKWSTIILDDAIKIPIGPRSYKKNSNNLKWGIGYDKNNKDGIYLTRYPDDIYFGNGKGILKLKNEFYPERFLSEKTKSFSNENASVLAKTSEQESKISDYFGLGIDLNTSFPGWNINSEIHLNSLDFNKFKKIATINSELSKVLFSKENITSKEEIKLSVFGIYREKVWNGSLGESEILTAYGLKVGSKKSTNNIDLKQSSLLALGYGEYQANKKSSSEDIISRKRLNLSYERDFTLPIWNPEIKEEINQEFKFSPEKIDRGFDLFISAKTDFYSYSDHNFQNLITFKAGPKMRLGDFKKNYLDYTELNVLAKTTIASGNSPFAFDQSVDKHAIELALKQQLIGPLIVKYSTEYNLDINSDRYHEFSNNKYELSWNRRAYNVGIFYNEERNMGGINFQINGFNFNGYGDKFR